MFRGGRERERESVYMCEHADQQTQAALDIITKKKSIPQHSFSFQRQALPLLLKYRDNSSY